MNHRRCLLLLQGYSRLHSHQSARQNSATINYQSRGVGLEILLGPDSAVGSIVDLDAAHSIADRVAVVGYAAAAAGHIVVAAAAVVADSTDVVQTADLAAAFDRIADLTAGSVVVVAVVQPAEAVVEAAAG